MKKLVCLLLSAVLIAGTAIGFSVFADGTKQVKNGDAELGTLEGWRGLFGDETTVISNVELDGNRVIKVEPKGAYASPMFDIGPAIINDTANGYCGGGAGKYIVSFRFKPENTISGDKYFSPTVCSGIWDKLKISNQNDWAIMKSGSDWTTVTKTFTVTEENLTVLKNLFDGGNADAYFMYLRLDGSGNRAFADGLYNYYIDDFTVTKEGSSTVNPSTPTPSPAEYKALEVKNGDAELGTLEGWTAMNGILENVEDNGNRVIKLTPNGAFGTAQFDMGPAIINDDSMKDTADYYAGGGAGKYKISFKIKAVDPASVSKNRYFILSLRSVDYNGVKPIVLENHAIITADKASDWTLIERSVTVTDEFLAEAKKAYGAGSTDAYKIYFRLDGSGNFAFADGTFDYYLDDFKIEKEAVKAGVKKTVSNGDAEKGTLENWDAMNGTLANVELDGNRVIKFTPDGVYGTPKFDIGPAIINDDSMKNVSDFYVGSGAGEYTVKFRIRPVESVDTSLHFMPTVRSFDWNVSPTIKFDANDHVIANGDGWTEITKKFTVTEDFLKELKAAYDAGNEEAYKIYLRLDGSGNFAFNNGFFAYYIDDFTITCDSAPVISGDIMPIATVTALISAASAAIYITRKKKEQI